MHILLLLLKSKEHLAGISRCIGRD